MSLHWVLSVHIHSVLWIWCSCSVRYTVKVKGKAIPLQTWIGSSGSRRLRFPGFLYNRHMKVARLLALRPGRLYHPTSLIQHISLVLIFFLEFKVYPSAAVGLEGLRQLNIPQTSSGIEPATIRLVGQCLNQLMFGWLV